MKLEHKFVVPAPVDEAWVAFNDLGRVVPCFPGATLTSAEGDEFTGSCKVKLGPVSLQYSGNGTFVERDESDHHAVIEAKGKDRRGNGTASVRVVARLTAADATSTQVTVDTDLTITGRPAQFGRGLIQEVSDRLLDQFTTCLTTTLQTPTTPAAPAPSTNPAAPAASAPSSTPATPPASAPSTTPATPPASAPSTTPATPAASAPSTTPATPAASAPSTEPAAQAQPAGPAQPAGSARPAGSAQPAGSARAAGAGQPGSTDQPASTGQPAAAAAPAAGTAASSATARGGGPVSASGSASDATSASPSDSTSASASGAASEPVELNLVTTMLPVLARRARPYLIGAVVALLLRRLFRR
ncbi:SRPBCC family protein [Kribbella sp. NPDC049227]|uniref:SRPBCC family protein n=1 Tax=Kribbella sp. NPDC049227 TaxID=3364113 RepID=UPI003719C482